MAAEPPFSKAHQAIGAYFCAFSAMERELGETIKVVFRLHRHEAADTITAALGDISKKTVLVLSATQLVKRPDRSDVTEDWKKNAAKTMSQVFKCNDERVLLAHSHLEPNIDGSVKITRLQVPHGLFKITEATWTQADFAERCTRIETTTRSLQSIRNDLDALTIVAPSLGWMDTTWQYSDFTRHNMCLFLWTT
jgi:hypothetical protein